MTLPRCTAITLGDLNYDVLEIILDERETLYSRNETPVPPLKALALVNCRFADQVRTRLFRNLHITDPGRFAVELSKTPQSTQPFDIASVFRQVDIYSHSDLAQLLRVQNGHKLCFDQTRHFQKSPFIAHHRFALLGPRIVSE
jgi:hypothetical protein